MYSASVLLDDLNTVICLLIISCIDIDADEYYRLNVLNCDQHICMIVSMIYNYMEYHGLLEYNYISELFQEIGTMG